MSILSRVPRDEYDALVGLSITRLKELRRSPQHYQHALVHPKESAPLTLGIATHVAVLEPERFDRDFAIWDRRTDSGRLAPRNGKWWDAFAAEHTHQTILTEDEATVAMQTALAVRQDPVAMKYLSTGDPEITMQWQFPLETPGIIEMRDCKGRADWLTTVEGRPTLVGLKTARDCRPMIFGNQCARLGYHIQMAWYHDAFVTITGKSPYMVEVVVESEAPHAVATYIIPKDVIEQGRDEYQALLRLLVQCEVSGEWPGPVPKEEYLTLPSWVFPRGEDDLEDLELEPIA
jgi:hypothetical protein